jgi:hypothetical protein
MLSEYGWTLEDPEPSKTRADVDAEVGELFYERRLSMTARRASDVFVWAGMFSTAHLLRALADEVDTPAQPAANFFNTDE